MHDTQRHILKKFPEKHHTIPFFKGKTKESPRKSIVYFDRGGNLNAVLYEDWKISFAVTNGNIATGVREITGWPMIVNLRADPYEKAPHEAGMGYLRWYADNMWLLCRFRV